MNRVSPAVDRCPDAVPAGRIFSRQVPFVLVVAVAGLLFLLLGALGAVTDAWRIDESFTYDIIQNSPLQIIRLTIADVHPPLFYLLLVPWVRLWPQPETMQIFSLLTGLAALFAVAWTGRLLHGRRLGGVVALLWATCPMFLHYCQDARMYPLALFFETLAVAGWALAPRRPRLGWILFVLALTASLYTQNLCLLFAAAFIGGETLRCLLARRPAGLAWILTAAGAIGLAYAPWIPILHRQMHSPGLTVFFHAPSWREIFYYFGFYPYTLCFTSAAKVWTWAPGLFLLGLLPLHTLVRKPRPAAGLDQRPLGMLLWLAAAPMLFLFLYSKYHKPIAELSRHEIMFLPFLLFPAAGWLVTGSRWRRGATLALVAVCGVFSLISLNHPRDKDLTAVRDALIERTPVGAPIFIYPPVPRFFRLLWHPLPLYDYDDDKPIPKNLTDCTLVINMESDFFREEIKRQANAIVTQGATAKLVYASYEVSAYQLHGLAPGTLRALLACQPGWGRNLTGNQVGRWSPTTFWPARQLGRLMRPKGEIIGFTPANPNWEGARLSATTTTLKLSPPGPQKSPASFGALMFGGYFIGNGKPQQIKTRLDRSAEAVKPLDSHDFLLARLVPGSAMEGAGTSLTLEIPPEMTQASPFIPGYPAVGIYLTWSGYRPLSPQDFRHPGVEGLYYDVGALGDELYLRSGFHEAEGMSPSEVRWTTDRFEVEVAAWPGSPLNEVVLFGILNRAIRDRRISVTVDDNKAGPTPLRAEETFKQSGYGQYALRLPKALAPGVHRLRFKVGTWVPKKEGVGNDPRKLGFYLDGIGLRPGR